MKMLTDDQIKEIAEEIDMGLECFWHVETNELLFIPDFDSLMYADDEEWQEDIQRVEAEWDKFVKITKPEPRESFKFMEEFAEGLPEKVKIKESLFRALNNKKPFAGFKYVIDNSGDYREIWFKFKAFKMREWVRKRIQQIIREKEE